MNAAISYKPVCLLLAAVLCTAGMWIYADRVFIPHQIADAKEEDRPRGNLSDLYPRWIGAQELLLHHADPYRAEVSRKIQTGYYGRPIDPSRLGDPHDEQGFAYPAYVVFLLAPTLHLPFATVQRDFFWLLAFVTSASVLLWLRVLRWSLPLWAQISLIALTLGGVGVVQALKLQQMSLLVAGLVAIAIALLVADYQIAAGVVLAVATIKPQLMVLLLFCLAIWTTGDWRRRHRLAISFLVSMGILIAASESYLPHWILRFWRAVHEYQRYTGSMSVLDTLLGVPWSWGLEFLALAATIVTCWRERRHAADTSAFASTLSLVLAATVLLVPTSAPYNQALLIPALLLLARERRAIWQTNLASRILLAITAVLVFWPWLASAALAALSFILPSEMVERGWILPLWTGIHIPLGVTALMLVVYYQRTFTPPVKPATS
jgi:Glycosyltransferase family 87